MLTPGIFLIVIMAIALLLFFKNKELNVKQFHTDEGML
jgi:hypothetical protein